MKDVGVFSKIFIAREYVDFRKHARGLASVVKEALGADPLCGKALFVFFNRRRDAVKLLYWDATGYALWWKCLEKERFKWKAKGDEAKIVISSRELKWLLQGVDLAKIKMHEALTFSQTH
jgi:transposase